MSHNHGHPHVHEIAGRRLRLAIGLTVLFVAVEAFVGWKAGSLALISDAGHNLADMIALSLSAFALWIARKPATHGKTYGYHRVGIVVALANALSLVAVALFIFIEALRRIQTPERIESGWMIAVACAALALNTVISIWLYAGAKHDINVRSAFVHQAADALSSLGVIIAGVIVMTTGNVIADPIVSLLIGAMILWSSWGILRESLDILLEATPKGMELAAVEASALRVAGVESIHDLHVWTISSGIVAASCHVLVAEQSARGAQAIAEGVSVTLEREHSITHSTVQVEVEHCGRDELLCTLRRNGVTTRPAAVTEE